jgi:hypothetical protein
MTNEQHIQTLNLRKSQEMIRPLDNPITIQNSPPVRSDNFSKSYTNNNIHEIDSRLNMACL